MYLRCVKSITTHVWWQLAKFKPYLILKISAVLAVCMGCEPKGLLCNFGKKLCDLCDQRQLDNPKHILFECNALMDYRNSKLQIVIETMPQAMAVSFQNFSIEDKMAFLLSGLHCSTYIDEWSAIMIKTCDFVYGIYHLRKSKYDSKATDAIT